MATKPTTLPQWADDAAAVVVEPSAGKKTAGWVVSERPPAQWLNWWMELVYDWMQYLNAPVGTGSGTGFSATGGPTDGAGLQGTGGGSNGSGTRGLAKGTGKGVFGNNDGSGAGTGNGVYGSISNAGTGSAVKGECFGTGNANAVEGVPKGTGAALRGNASENSGHGAHLTGNATAAPLAMDTQATPSSGAAGDVYPSSVDGGLHVHDGSRWQRVNSMILNYVDPVAEASASDSVTGAGGTFATKATIPGGTLRVGSVIEATAICEVGGTGGSGSDLQLQLRVGGTVYAQLLFGSFAGGIPSDRGVLRATCVISVIGAAGDVGGGGISVVTLKTGVSTTIAWRGRDTELDTTSDIDVDVVATVTGGSGGDSVGLYQFTVEVK